MLSCDQVQIFFCLETSIILKFGETTLDESTNIGVLLIILTAVPWILTFYTTTPLRHVVDGILFKQGMIQKAVSLASQRFQWHWWKHPEQPQSLGGVVVPPLLLRGTTPSHDMHPGSPMTPRTPRTLRTPHAPDSPRTPRRLASPHLLSMSIDGAGVLRDILMPSDGSGGGGGGEGGVDKDGGNVCGYGYGGGDEGGGTGIEGGGGEGGGGGNSDDYRLPYPVQSDGGGEGGSGEGGREGGGAGGAEAFKVAQPAPEPAPKPDSEPDSEPKETDSGPKAEPNAEPNADTSESKQTTAGPTVVAAPSTLPAVAAAQSAPLTVSQEPLDDGGTAPRSDSSFVYQGGLVATRVLQFTRNTAFERRRSSFSTVRSPDSLRFFGDSSNRGTMRPPPQPRICSPAAYILRQRAHTRNPPSKHRRKI